VEFRSFATGDPYFALLRIANAGGVGSWAWTADGEVVP